MVTDRIGTPFDLPAQWEGFTTTGKFVLEQASPSDTSWTCSFDDDTGTELIWEASNAVKARAQCRAL
ncbi:hypothetical protein [Roseivivax sp. CAU 1761]